MAVAHTLSCIIQASTAGFPSNLNLNNNKIPNSIAKLHIHPRYDSDLRCCCYHPRFYANPKYLSKGKLKDFVANGDTDIDRQVMAMVFDDSINRQVLSVAVVLRDEDGQLRKFMGYLVDNITLQDDAYKSADLLLDDLVPLLLQNADRWVSNQFWVVSNHKESFLKVNESDKMLADKFIFDSDEVNHMLGALSIGENTPKTTRCVRVIMQIAIIGVIDDEFKESITCDDFKLLLKHLMSVEGVTSGLASCETILLKGC